MQEITNSKNTLQNNTCEGKCSRCGECCGLFIPFNEEDINRIKKYVKDHNIKQFNRVDKLKGTFKAHCCFYDEDKKICTIYEVRPFACKDFICSRENWKEKRNDYEKNAKYNSTVNKTILASFDDMIYNDYEPILRYVLGLITNNNKLDDKVLVGFLMQINRLDLLKYILVEDDNGNKINGTDLLK